MYQSSILAQDSGNGGSSVGLLFFLIIPVAMYFLMIRPQRKRQRQQAELQASIGIGDEVVTNSGIYGFITGEEDDKFWLEIDENVQIRIAKAAIQASKAADESKGIRPRNASMALLRLDVDSEAAVLRYKGADGTEVERELRSAVLFTGALERVVSVVDAKKFVDCLKGNDIVEYPEAGQKPIRFSGPTRQILVMPVRQPDQAGFRPLKTVTEGGARRRRETAQHG